MNIKLWWQIHRETRKNSYYLSPSHHGGGYFLIVAKELKVWFDAIRMPWNKKYNTQLYEGKRKNKIQMLWENIVWAFKYREACTCYFLYGLDVKGTDPNKYVGYNEFRIIRNILNIRQRETLPTNYTFNYLALVRDKYVFYKFCDSLHMPHPKLIALVRNGEISMENRQNMEFEDLRAILSLNADAFCKETTGELGRGAFPLKIEAGRLYTKDEEITIDELKKKFGKSTYVIQERLTNHPAISEVYPHSLNTIRLNTIMNEDGNVEYYGAELRFGTGGNFVDNAGQGGFFVGINEDGTLKNIGYYDPGKRQVSIVREKHPDTEVTFAGLKIPYWQEIKQQSILFHKYLYGLPSLGWDIAVTEEGFYFTEAGEDWEIQLDQCAYGGRRKDFYRTHGYALEKKIRRY